jgi:hypothetical protein
LAARRTSIDGEIASEVASLLFGRRAWGGANDMARRGLVAPFMLVFTVASCGGGANPSARPTNENASNATVNGATGGSTALTTVAPTTTRDPNLIRVEPKNRATFGPETSVPAGSVFHVAVVAQSDTTALHLHRCDVPCSSAFVIKVWSTTEAAVGVELMMRVDLAAVYYLWGEDTKGSGAVRIVGDERSTNKLRVTFASGLVVDAWYT